jgi:hypothetical protein
VRPISSPTANIGRRRGDGGAPERSAAGAIDCRSDQLDRGVDTQHMGDLASALGNGFSSLISRSLEIIGNVVNGIVQTFNAVLPGSALLAVVGIFFLVALIWAIRKR